MADVTGVEREGQGAVASYENDEAARWAYREGAALADRSHWALIRVTGSTRHAFLHNLTTANVNALRPGQGQEAVFLTATARTIDLATLLATDEAIWVVASPERAATLLAWMPRFVFFMDDVQFHDEQPNLRLFSLLGPASGALLAALGGGDVLGEPRGSHALATLAGVAGVRVVVGGGLLGPGYTLVVPSAGAEALWQALRAGGAEPMGEAVWELLRVEQGRPAADRELTESYNPLEAGLWEAVSFDKGCYIGQEIVARLDTYQKLKQQLWGIRLAAPVAPGTPVLHEGQAVGSVTSAAITPGGPHALAYVRVKAGGAGLAVQAGEVAGTLVELPYLSRERKY